MQTDPKNILLLTKNYPPQIGGIEKYAFDLHNRLVSEGNNVKLIAAGARNEWLLAKKGSRNTVMKSIFTGLYIASELGRLAWFAIRCFTEGAWWLLKMNNVSAAAEIMYNDGFIKNGNNEGNELNTQNQLNGVSLIWSMDGSIGWLGYFLSKIRKSVTRVTLHGTDVVWGGRFYQSIIPWFWRKTDEVIAISENTLQETLKRGVKKESIQLIPHTSETITYTDPGDFDQVEFLESLGIQDVSNKTILFSIGRWIERKGFHWFLENIMPELDQEKFHYILAGFGPYENKYKEIIAEKGLKNVTIVGKVDDLTKAKLFTSSDLFIMPNIPVEGDIEGFGLVLLEAEFYKLKIIASKIDGVNETVGQEGVCLISERNKESWIFYIKAYLTGTL